MLVRKRTWGYDPQSGGITIPDAVKPRICQRILDHAEKHYSVRYNRIDVRFSGKFCYIDAYTEPYVPEDYDPALYRESREEHIERLRNTPTHLCRLRYFGDDDRWSMAFYTYSHEKYEPCFFNTGSWEGTPEEAFDTSAVYLMA
jgi:hypothetical protein